MKTGEIRTLLVLAAEQMVKHTQELAADPGDPGTGRMSKADSIAAVARLANDLHRLPLTDQRLVTLAARFADVDAWLAGAEALDDDGMIRLDVDGMLDHLVEAMTPGE